MSTETPLIITIEPRRHAPGLAFEPSGSCSFNDRSCVSCGDTNNGEASHRRCVLSLHVRVPAARVPQAC